MNTDQPIPKSILIEGDLTEKILGAAFKVQNKLGARFLEKVYVNALSFESQRSGLTVEPQKIFAVK
jgi:GxxExxY protein